nr:glycosyltransferase [Variovorax boronicumulans]
MNTGLRIALISEHASPLAPAGGVDAGGQNIYVDHVARTLARRGHRVDVFTRRDAPGLPDVQPLCRGARVVHVAAGPDRYVRKEDLLQHMPQFMRSCERWMRHNAYDLAHANFFMSGLVARHLQQRLGLPFAITFHALGLVRLQHQKSADTFPPERIEIERDCVRDADAVIAECPQDRADLIGLYNAAPQRLALVPCGFDPQEFAPMDRAEARRALGLEPDEFLVLQLGRLVPRKGVDNVVHAMALLRDRLPPGRRARLLVVGGETPEPDAARTPEIGRLRALAGELGIAAEVQFTGHRARHALRPFYAAADVFVSTPWYEPFGITPLEAMACAIPVLASDVGGLRHSVVDGATGFLVPPHDPAALTARLALLQQDPALAARLGAAGRRRVQRLFTWDKVVDGLLGVYRGIRRVPVPARRSVHAAGAGRLALAAQERPWL